MNITKKDMLWSLKNKKIFNFYFSSLFMVCITPQVYHRIEAKDTPVRNKNTRPEIHVRKCLSMDTFWHGHDWPRWDGIASRFENAS